MRPEAHCKSTNAPAKSNWRKKDKKQNDEKVKTPQPKKKEVAAKHNGKQRKKEAKKQQQNLAQNISSGRNFAIMETWRVFALQSQPQAGFQIVEKDLKINTQKQEKEAEVKSLILTEIVGTMENDPNLSKRKK